MKLREAVAQKLGFNSADAVVRGRPGALGQPQRAARPRRPARAASSPKTRSSTATSTRSYQQSTFGAHFVEVGVDAATGEIRVRRMLAVCAAGRILNPKTARSQVIGGMTMGVGAALMEELAVDKRLGFFVNHDLAGYEVPVHADIPHQDVIFLDETDPMSSPMKAKGVGELGICGVGGGGRQRDLQRHRRARARLSDHAGQAARPHAGRGVSAGSRGAVYSKPDAGGSRASTMITRRRSARRRRPRCALAVRAPASRPNARGDQERMEHQAKRLAAVRQGTGRLVHRHGAHRSAVPARPIRPASPAPASPSSPARARRGTRIRSARR